MPILMRAKFSVSAVDSSNSSEQWPCETISAAPVCKTGGYPEDGSDEDNSYARWSPSGSLSLTITNPNLIGKIKAGDKFYLDFTPVPADISK